MTLRLRTFGAVYLERDGTPLGGAHSQRRRLALLTYLAAADKGAVRREKLIALLWPESDESSARHSLSQLLYALRHDLGADAIVVDSETVRLNSEKIPSDAREFDEAVRSGERLEHAVGLYRGNFLEDFHLEDAPEFDRWADAERARLTFACARALDRLAEDAGKSRDWHRAVEWLRRRVALDPADGRATLRLMQALAGIGDRDGALRVARVHETLLRHDLQAELDPAIVRLVAELRRVPTSPIAVMAAPLPVASAPSVAAPVAPRPAEPPQTTRRTSAGATMPARRLILVGVGLAAALAATALVSRARGESRHRDGPNALVVIGDLDGPDSTLALAVREALRAELVNTRGVLLISDQGIRELKTLTRLPADAPLRTAALLTLANRSGAHVAISGSVLPVGEGAQIVLELLDPVTARSIRTFAERPVNGTATLAAVDRLARLIGRDVSRAPRDSAVRPLPAVTTSSLAALKSYALARQTAALGRRHDAVAPAERAVTHDSTFVLAHYLLGDLLWFIDEQTHAEAHLSKAYELLSTVPPREQLVIRARYEQLARDRPDSALVYWQLLADASPGDVLAYEGRAWALRALGRHEEAAAAADTAISLDPGAILPNTNNAMYSWLAVGDTTSALAVGKRVAARYPEALIEARFYTALYRDPAEALAWADSTSVQETRRWRRHHAQIALGQVGAARATADSIVADNRMAYAPNAMVNQGWLELIRGDGRVVAARRARQALEWTRTRDLSPPGVARLAERIADLAARAGDESLVRSTIALVHERDRGRSLRTYEMARKTLDAALAYARGDFVGAARRAAEARRGVYFTRSLATIVQLEADARRAAGQIAAADSLARLVSTHQIVDGHFEAWMILRAVTSRRAGAE